MRIGVRNPEAGLFSHLNFVITHIDNLDGAKFYVDWTEGNPYVSGAGNLFDELFVQSDEFEPEAPLVRQWPHQRYTGSQADSLYRGTGQWRWRLHRCWSYLKVRNEIIEEAEAFAGGWAGSATAVHVRNRKIGVECPGGKAPALEDYGRVLYGLEGPVFLATDNEEAVAYFRSLLGERLRTRDIPRSADMDTEYHLAHVQSPADARSCLVDALIMARCARLIHSVSNIATAVLYMNPRIPHIYLNSWRAHFLGAEPEDTSLRDVRAVIARNESPHVIRLEHSRWKDWGVVYGKKAVVRHDSGCAGLLTERKEGELEIRWLDWGTEVFCQKAICSSRPELASIPLSYELCTQPRIEVWLRGGLGNQMFQYGFGLHLARRAGAELILRHDGSMRNFALRMFGLINQCSACHSEAELEWYDDYEEGIEEEMIGDVLADPANSIKVQGWFQNERFFLPVAEEVRKQFDFRIPLPSFAAGRQVVAVHVRLGDYLQSTIHRPLPADYYATALGKMRRDLDDPLFLVFSDDPRGCPECLRDQEDVMILPWLYDEQAFGLMSSCNAFIIANSSFSWWAAWLSGSEKVVCPATFLPGKKWTICPDRWDHIPVSYEF
jgi:hypothetical protein